jgi:hypothetical protein
VISRIRKSIAAAFATLVTVLTLGRVRINWRGGPGAADEAGNPRQPAATRQIPSGRPRPGRR